MRSGAEAVELLAASDRVKEDCAYALQANREDYAGFAFCLVVREWAQTIALEQEFRGIVWKGQARCTSVVKRR